MIFCAGLNLFCVVLLLFCAMPIPIFRAMLGYILWSRFIFCAWQPLFILISFWAMLTLFSCCVDLFFWSRWYSVLGYIIFVFCWSHSMLCSLFFHAVLSYIWWFRVIFCDGLNLYHVLSIQFCAVLTHFYTVFGHIFWSRWFSVLGCIIFVFCWSQSMLCPLFFMLCLCIV